MSEFLLFRLDLFKFYLNLRTSQKIELKLIISQAELARELILIFIIIFLFLNLNLK